MVDWSSEQEKEKAFQRRRQEYRREREEKRREIVERIHREYGHTLSREEFSRKVEEEECRAIQEDPRYKAAIRQGEQERAARKAEAEQRRQRVEEQYRAKAREELEQERQRRLNVWLSHGGDEQSFNEAWPSMKRKILEEKQAALDRQRADSSVF